MAEPSRRLPPNFIPPGYESRQQYLFDYARQDVTKALSDENYTRAERSQLIKGLANGPFAAVLIPPDDNWLDGRDKAGHLQGMNAVGRALEEAVQDKALDVTGMHKLAASAGAGGQQRLYLLLHAGGHGPGSGTEQYADSLWAQRNDPGKGDNAAIAAIAYQSDPALRASKLGDPEQRRQAFEALIEFNDKAPYAKLGEPAAGEMKRQALTAAATLFRDHGQELIAAYTDGAMRTGPLAKFISQSMLNPDAKGLKLDDGRDVATAVGDTLKKAATDCIAKADDPAMQGANRPSREQERQLEKLARIGASVSGGVSMAWDAYKDKINETEQSRKAFSSVVEKAIGLVPGSGLGKDVVEKIGEEAAKRIGKAFIKDPSRPDVEIGDAMNQYYSDLVRGLADARKQSGLTTDTYGQAYRQEYENLTDKLNRRLDKRADAGAVRGDTQVASAGHDLVDRLSAAMKSGDRDAYRQQLATASGADGQNLRQQASATVDAQERQGAERTAPTPDTQVAQTETARGPRMG